MNKENTFEYPNEAKQFDRKLKYVLIDTITECLKIVEEILLKETIMALDCEGVLLSKEGRLTLIQISLLDERVFIFDILKGGSLMFLGLEENRLGLKAVLENKKILKIIHDCRNDWDSLLHQYSVRIYNFIDTQEAYFVYKLFYHHEITLPISLSKFIINIINSKLEYKEKFKNVMNEDPYMWSKRPFTEEQLLYASEDVVFLIRAWQALKHKFNENLKEIIFFITILKVVDISIFFQFREYLIANIIYFGMLENVFNSDELNVYIFSIDYVYNFLQIKTIKEKKSSNLFTNNNVLPDENYYKFIKEKKTSAFILKYGLNFKEKQRILSLKVFKEEEEMHLIEKTGKINLNGINHDLKCDNIIKNEMFSNFDHSKHYKYNYKKKKNYKKFWASGSKLNSNNYRNSTEISKNNGNKMKNIKTNHFTFKNLNDNKYRYGKGNSNQYYLSNNIKNQFNKNKKNLDKLLIMSKELSDETSDIGYHTDTHLKTRYPTEKNFPSEMENIFSTCQNTNTEDDILSYLPNERKISL